MYLLLLSSSQLPPRSLHLRLFPPPLLCLSSTPSTTGSHVPRFLSSSPIDRPNFSLSIFAPRESGRERIAVLSNAIGGERIAFLFRRFPLSLFFRAAFESRYLSSRFIDRPSIGTVEKLTRKTLRYRMRDVSRRFRSLKADILLNFKANRSCHVSTHSKPGNSCRIPLSIVFSPPISLADRRGRTVSRLLFGAQRPIPRKVMVQGRPCCRETSRPSLTLNRNRLSRSDCAHRSDDESYRPCQSFVVTLFPSIRRLRYLVRSLRPVRVSFDDLVLANWKTKSSKPWSKPEFLKIYNV